VSPAITEELIGPVFVPPDADTPGAEGQGIIPAIGGVALSIVPADAPLVFDEGAAVAEMDEAFEDACGWDDGACFALGYEDAEDEGQVTAAGTDGAAGLVTMPTVSRAAPQGQPVIQNFPSPPQRSAPAAPAPPLSSGAAQPSSAATQPSSAAAQPSRAAVQTEDPPSAPATTLRRRNRGNGDDDSSQSGAGGGSATVPAAVAPQSVHREPQPVQAQPQQPATRAGNRSRNGNDDNGDRPRASQPSQPQVQRGSSPPAQPATVSQPARGHDASTAPVAQPQPVTRSVDQGNSARGSSNGNGNGRGGDARHGR
jgi:hypothetical protein